MVEEKKLETQLVIERELVQLLKQAVMEELDINIAIEDCSEKILNYFELNYF
ncbi:hypothetical protein [Leptospira sp. 'Mane']|uniref:hypothetical protein n=1 Tax=Leptospira sp. 'Mane' TaxID=3387407 RepID=UPI00398AEA67